MDLTPWLLWLVGSLGWGTALVAAVASARLAHIDPAAIEVARSLGLGHWTRWRLLVRPTIRPAVAQAGSLVFSMVVFDPGPALVLGLRRSLAYEAIRSLPLIGGTPRAFAIGVGMTVVCLFAHFVVFRPGQRSPEATIPKQIPPLRQLRSGFTIPLLIGLATWSGLALTTVPLLFLALSARNFDQSFGINITGSLLFATALGIAAVMGSGWLVGRDEKAVSRPLPVRIVLPPLVVGLGVLALGPFSRDLIGFVQQLGMGGSAADPFRHVAPKLIQAVGLVVAMGIAWLPWVRAGSVSTRYLAFLAAFAVSSAAPMIGFGSNQGLTTLGVLLVELPGDSRGFLGIATFSVVMNLVALSAVCLDKRCHVGDRLV